MPRVSLATLAAIVITLLGLLLQRGPLPHPPKANADSVSDIVGLNPLLCSYLKSVQGGSPIPCTTANLADANFNNLVSAGADGVRGPEDFFNIDLDANHIHESSGELVILAFVPSQAQATIQVQNGVIHDRNGNDRGAQWVCGSESVPQGDDPDCIAAEPNANGVIAFSIVPDPAGARGRGTVTLTQGVTVRLLEFRVVGDAVTTLLERTETAVQIGADRGSLNLNGQKRPQQTPSTDDDCVRPVPPTVVDETSINADATRTVVLARTLDSDGTPITGAFLHWQSNDPEIGTAAVHLTPSVAPFGGAEATSYNVICGTAGAGAFSTLIATTATQFPGSGAILDPGATGVSVSPSFTTLAAPTPANDPDGDGMTDGYEGAHVCLDSAIADGDSDFDADALSSRQEMFVGTNPCDLDTDGDGCADGREHPLSQLPHINGGERDPLDEWDFYDVTGDAIIDLQDTLAVLEHFGQGTLHPGYDAAFDRRIPLAIKPWRTGAASNGIDLIDALVNLESFGNNCSPAL